MGPVEPKPPSPAWLRLSARRHTAVTAAEDGTLRIWDTETATQRTVVKPTVDRPGRVAVTACAYGDDGALLAAGLSSGVLQLWDVKGAWSLALPVWRAWLVSASTGLSTNSHFIFFGDVARQGAFPACFCMACRVIALAAGRWTRRKACRQHCYFKAGRQHMLKRMSMAPRPASCDWGSAAWYDISSRGRCATPFGGAARRQVWLVGGDRAGAAAQGADGGAAELEVCVRRRPGAPPSLSAPAHQSQRLV